jgi:Domain of unknown function (DUF4926)
MTTLKFNDSVELLKDVPERNLSKGAQGTVVFIFSEPRPAYEVEFVAEDGSTIAELALEPDAIPRLSSNRSKQGWTFTSLSAVSKSETIVRVRKDSGSFIGRDKESGRRTRTQRAKRKAA